MQAGRTIGAVSFNLADMASPDAQVITKELPLVGVKGAAGPPLLRVSFQAHFLKESMEGDDDASSQMTDISRLSIGTTAITDDGEDELDLDFEMDDDLRVANGRQRQDTVVHVGAAAGGAAAGASAAAGADGGRPPRSQPPASSQQPVHEQLATLQNEVLMLKDKLSRVTREKTEGETRARRERDEFFTRIRGLEEAKRLLETNTIERHTSHDDDLRALRVELDEERLARTKIEGECNHLRVRVAQEEAENEQLTEDLKTANELLASGEDGEPAVISDSELSAQVRALQEKNRKAADEIRALQEENHALTNEAHDRDEQVKRLKVELDSVGDVRQAGAEGASVDKQLIGARAQVRDLETMVKRRDDELADVRGKLEETAREAGDFMAQLIEAKVGLAEAVGDKYAVEQDLKQTRKRLQVARETNVTLGKQVNALELKYERAKN